MRRSTQGAEAQRWRQRRESTQVRATSHARRNDMTWCSIASGSALRRSSGAAPPPDPDVSPAEHSLGFFVGASSSIWPALHCTVVDSFLASESSLRENLEEVGGMRWGGGFDQTYVVIRRDNGDLLPLQSRRRGRRRGRRRRRRRTSLFRNFHRNVGGGGHVHVHISSWSSSQSSLQQPM